MAKRKQKLSKAQVRIASQALAGLMAAYPQLQERTKATEVAKALVAGMRVIAQAQTLDGEPMGPAECQGCASHCACLEGKTRWGMADAVWAPIDAAGHCQRCGQIRRAPQSARPSDLEKRS